MSRRQARRGIALPLVLLVLVALGMLASLALGDALQASRVATLAEDAVEARAAAMAGDALMLDPPDLAWLCLQSPVQPLRRVVTTAHGGRAEIMWWMVPSGIVRVQVTGIGARGARYRRLAWLRPDSIVPADPRPGCPEAKRLEPAAKEWRMSHPEG